MLIKVVSIPSPIWISPKSVSYVYKNSDGETVIGCGDERFTIPIVEIDRIVDFINETLKIESAFDKIK